MQIRTATRSEASGYLSRTSSGIYWGCQRSHSPLIHHQASSVSHGATGPGSGGGPLPVHTLKRVDRLPTLIHDDLVQRVDERESGFMRAGRGDFVLHLKEEYFHFVQRHPLSNALLKMGFNLLEVELTDRNPLTPIFSLKGEGVNRPDRTYLYSKNYPPI